MNIKTKEQKTEERKSIIKSMEIKRAKAINTKNGTMVVFDIIINDVTLYSCKVASGKNGDFISFPSYKGSDGKYYNNCYVPLTEEDTKKIIAELEKILNA